MTTLLLALGIWFLGAILFCTCWGGIMRVVNRGHLDDEPPELFGIQRAKPRLGRPRGSKNKRPRKISPEIKRRDASYRARLADHFYSLSEAIDDHEFGSQETKNFPNDKNLSGSVESRHAGEKTRGKRWPHPDEIASIQSPSIVNGSGSSAPPAQNLLELGIWSFFGAWSLGFGAFR